MMRGNAGAREGFRIATVDGSAGGEDFLLQGWACVWPSQRRADGRLHIRRDYDETDHFGNGDERSADV
jgi:hypothetical protein